MIDLLHWQAKGACACLVFLKNHIGKSMIG
jgi:hypothetical protein